jgi:hypothetical protein
MSPPEPPNPERKSNNAMLCLCVGLGLLVLTWLLGVGTAFTAALSGGLAGAVVGVAGGIVLMLAAGAGVVLMFVGVIWTAVRVIADQRGAPDRYRDVQR